MTADLAVFLLACLDADEQVARAATPGPWAYDGNPSRTVFSVAEGNRSLSASCWNTDQDAANATHIALHDPAFVLADIAAKKTIVELHSVGHECAKLDEASWAGWFDDPAQGFEHCDTLRLLAQPYRGRPGWSDEWSV